MKSVKTPRTRLQSALVGLAAVLFVATIWVLPACTAQSATDGGSNSGDVVGKIGDRAITMQDLEAAAKENLAKVEAEKVQCESNYKRNRHGVLEAALNEMVSDGLLEAEAAARGITKDQLMDQEVNSKTTPVTDADIDAFYNENAGRIRQPKERVADQIRTYLENQQRQSLVDGLLSQLEAKTKVVKNLGPYRVDVANGDLPPKGSASAPVTIVEFSDFQCPYCSRVNPTVQQVMQEYGDKVKIYFRHFPLSFHENAQKAAEASLCANDQGKFWAMHDLMFAEQDKLTVDALKEKAARLELDTNKFNQCLDSGQHAGDVQTDMQAGVAAGVSGTPGFFINGRFVSGAQPFEAFKEIIDDELQRVAM